MQVDGAEQVFTALNRAGVRYLVVGGLAVNAHGYVRFTMDIDLVIGLERSNIIAGLDALIAAGFRPAVPVTPEEFAEPLKREGWRREKDMRVLKMWSDRFKLSPLDIFVYEPFDFPREYERAMTVSLREGLDVPIVSLPALLAMKREAGRPQDLADIAALEDMGT